MPIFQYSFLVVCFLSVMFSLYLNLTSKVSFLLFVWNVISLLH